MIQEAPREGIEVEKVATTQFPPPSPKVIGARTSVTKFTPKKIGIFIWAEDMYPNYKF